MTIFQDPEGNRIYGCSIGYGLDSMFGPLEASLGYSNQSKDVGFYVNLGFSFKKLNPYPDRV